MVTLMSGCATYPNKMTKEADAKVKTVGILEEISTPTSLVTPSNANAGQAGVVGLLISSGIEAGQQKDFTTQVRGLFDFQALAENTLRESFTKAVKNRPGWALAASNENSKADAMFVLKVTRLGIDNCHSHTIFPPKLEYQPTVTVTATLIGNPPFEIVDNDGPVVKVLEPEKHPILYHRIECISYVRSAHIDSDAAKNFVKQDGITVYSWKYSGDANLTKEAFREAIDLAVKRIAESWTVTEK